MDDDERESNASSENEQDEVMDEADDIDNGDNGDTGDNDNEVEAEAEEEENEDEDEDEGDSNAADTDKVRKGKQVERSSQRPAAAGAAGGTGGGPAPSTGNATAGAGAGAGAGTSARPSSATASSAPPTPRWRPRINARLLNARLYDIVPTMAAPQATSINAFAATPDNRFWMTGGSDGYVRKYDGIGTINGKQLLTVAQRQPFVDSVVKAGILMSYWENEEHAGTGAGGAGGSGGAAGAGAGSGAGSSHHHGRSNEEHVLSPVYSLAVHAQGLWLLSGTEGGAINLSSVRHDEGKRIACLTKHTSAVSVLQLLPDEMSVLSGSWDKTVLDWDLNNGNVRRKFEGSGGQISAIELRPASGSPFPRDAWGEQIKSESIWGSTSSSANPFGGATGSGSGKPLRAGGPGVDGAGSGSGLPNGIGGDAGDAGQASAGDGGGDAGFGSPAHESLFGSPAGSLFGDDTMGGSGNVFGDDDNHSMDIDMPTDDATMGDGADAPPGSTVASAAAPDATLTVSGAGSSTVAAPSDLPPSQPSGASATAPAAPSSSATQDTTTQAESEASSQQQQHQQLKQELKPEPHQDQKPPSPALVFNSSAAPPHHDPTQTSDSVFMAAAIDGPIRVWDRRVPNPVARISTRMGVPPWCMGACWSPDGNWIYAGRRNGTVEEFNIHKARGGWAPERTLKLPQGSGAVSCVRPMANGRHLVCASHDILRLYDLRDTSAVKGSAVPFLIIPGPPRAGVISQLYIDPSSRFMVSIAGTRGWDGSSTEVLVGYEINAAATA